MNCLVWIIFIFQMVTTMISTQSQPMRSLVTFNAGLTGRIPNRKLRASYIQEHLKTLRNDVICLQEYWYQNDVMNLVQSLQNTHPYSFSAVHSSKTFFQRCLQRRDQFEICALQTVRIMELPQECITCLVTSGFDRVFSDCIGSNSGGINVPGLVLLSRLPLRNVKKVDLIPGIKQLLPRSYLYAEVDGIGSVACTHLTAYLSNIYFEPSLRTTFRSWAEQNLYEVRTLLSGLRHLPRVIVLGDLNSGPSVPERTVIPAIQESFFTFIKNKFTAPYVDWIGQCTYCRENPIAGTNHNFILDHILLKGYEARMVRRIFDHLIPGQGYPSSDHYGVEVTLPEWFENRPCHYILNLYSIKRFLPHGLCT